MDLGNVSCRKKRPIHSWNWKLHRGWILNSMGPNENYPFFVEDQVG